VNYHPGQACKGRGQHAHVVWQLGAELRHDVVRPPEIDLGRVERDGPAVEALRHAIHDPGAVAPWLDAVLFDNAVHLAVYQALVETDTHAEALRAAPAESAARLLARLLADVPDPRIEPTDAVRLLHQTVARREIAAVRSRAATDADATRAIADLALLTRTIDGLRDAQAWAAAADRLLAWLREDEGNRTSADAAAFVARVKHHRDRWAEVLALPQLFIAT
jgi:hypothetical protein